MRLFKFIICGSLLALFMLLQVSLPVSLAENGFNPIKAEESTEAIGSDCASCHQSQTKVFNLGVHSTNGITCTDCHQVQRVNGVCEDELSDPQNIPSTCGACHAGDIFKSYQESFHGRALALGSERSADCTSCHEAHYIVDSNDPNSPVAGDNLPVTCSKCHFEPLDNYAVGVEHKVIEANGAGIPQYYTLKFFIWLTIITVVCLVLHMELELFHLFRKAKQKK